MKGRLRTNLGIRDVKQHACKSSSSKISSGILGGDSVMLIV